MRRAAGVLVVLLGLSLCAAAAPAPWYLWRSKVNGKAFCFRASPGEGWEQVDGPFRDACCERPA